MSFLHKATQVFVFSHICNNIHKITFDLCFHFVSPIMLKSAPSILPLEYPNGCRQIILNRVASHNALNLEMFEKILLLLKRWELDPAAACILFTGAGRKAFCSGGDLKEVTSSDEEARFRMLEYNMDLIVHQYPKPCLSIINGVAIGGGAALACLCKYRIATDHTILSMPETTLGFFTDVGSTYFLSKCPGQIGLYLALTGSQIGAADALFAHLVTHYVPLHKLDQLTTALSSCDVRTPQQIEALLNSFTESCGQSTLAEHLELINRCFTANSVEDILINLSREKQNAFARKTLEKIQRNCPMSLKVTFEMIRRNKGKSLKDALRLEYRVGCRMIHRSDFKEGVRALLIDKDFSPKWNPPTLQEITDEDVSRLFEPLPSSLELSFELFTSERNANIKSKL